MNADQLTAIRARLDALECRPAYEMNFSTYDALLAVARAASAVVDDFGPEREGDPFCRACCYGRREWADDHAGDCPAVAIDAALAALADAPGEVQP